MSQVQYRCHQPLESMAFLRHGEIGNALNLFAIGHLAMIFTP
jgi:hypothetical protein